jgi:FkbM family methyltransferase
MAKCSCCGNDAESTYATKNDFVYCFECSCGRKSMDLKNYKGSPSQYFGNITASQHFEDGLFCAIFWALKVDKPSYLDIGCNDPVEISNTALLYSRGSRGVNIDANPNVINKFNKERPEDVNVNIGVAEEPGKMWFHYVDKTSGLNTFKPGSRSDIEFKESELIEVTTLSQILNTHGVPDLLLLDIEGLDCEVITSTNFKIYKPKVICFEAWQNEAKPVIEYLKSCDYEILMRCGANLVAVQSEYAWKLKE